MKILVIGGTVFVGRHFVVAAQSRGHDVVLFHRGQRGKDLFPECRHVFGDRDGQIANLGEEHFDAVVDCCGYVPRVVAQSTEYLRDRTDRYLFVSTISVYADSQTPGQDEDAPVGKLKEPTEEITGESYGPLKALCENEVRRVYGDRATIVRPGLIAGPYDPTNRFTYWVSRVAEGGRVLAPARPDQPMQLIDACDLANFMVLLLENHRAGTYNAAGDPTTFGDMLEACHRLNLGAQIVWAEEAFLQTQGVALWQDLPLTLPFSGEDDGMMRVDTRRARAAGLDCRALADTARDTHAWRSAEPDPAPRFGMSREREAEVLSALADAASPG